MGYRKWCRRRRGSGQSTTAPIVPPAFRLHNGMLLPPAAGGGGMSKLHSQLALFGAIDTEVTLAKTALKQGAEGEDAAKHTAVIAMAGQFLPGTTGFGQNGWYAELGKFINRPEVRRSDEHSNEHIEFPDLTSALSELQTTTNERDDRDPVLARAVYGAIILKK